MVDTSIQIPVVITEHFQEVATGVRDELEEKLRVLPQSVERDRLLTALSKIKQSLNLPVIADEEVLEEAARENIPEKIIKALCLAEAFVRCAENGETLTIDIYNDLLFDYAEQFSDGPNLLN